MDTTMAVLALITGVLVLATAVVTLILTVINKRKAERTDRKVQQVHVLVNSQMAAMVARVEQLVAALEASDTDVPPPPTPGNE